MQAVMHAGAARGAFDPPAAMRRAVRRRPYA
jgi:hypothetical protein